MFRMKFMEKLFKKPGYRPQGDDTKASPPTGGSNVMKPKSARKPEKPVEPTTNICEVRNVSGKRQVLGKLVLEHGQTAKIDVAPGTMGAALLRDGTLLQASEAWQFETPVVTEAVAGDLPNVVSSTWDAKENEKRLGIASGADRDNPPYGGSAAFRPTAGLDDEIRAAITIGPYQCPWCEYFTNEQGVAQAHVLMEHAKAILTGYANLLGERPKTQTR